MKDEADVAGHEAELLLVAQAKQPRALPDAHAGVADGVEVDDVLQVGDVGVEVVVLDDVGAVERLGDRDPQ